MNRQKEQHLTKNVAIILLPGFALTSFSLTVEAFSVANAMAGQDIYQCRIYSGSPHPEERCIVSSNGIPIMTEQHISELADADLICLCAYWHAATYHYDVLNKTLKDHYKKGGQLASLSSGSFIFARAGLLERATCTVTAEQQDIFHELYPTIPVQENLYTVSGRIFTCRGGTTALDMMMYIIGVDHGTELTAQISQQFQADRIRTLEEINRSSKYLSLRLKSPALGAAVEIMETNIEEPYSIETLCSMIGCSARHLEMIFRKYMKTTPNKHYLNIRLAKAKKLVEETGMPLSTIASACGFSSHSYMGQCFKTKYGVQPSVLRMQ